jgi:hypothetical protein
MVYIKRHSNACESSQMNHVVASIRQTEKTVAPHLEL